MVDEGSKIVEEVLREWAQRCAADGQDGEDVIMDDDEKAEKDIATLKECMGKYQNQIEGNPWIQSLIATL